MIELSEHQQSERAKLRAAIATGKRVIMLVGPAGSGKTTLLRSLVDEYEQTREVVPICPTGKAAHVLSDKIGRDASTVHQSLYGRVWEGKSDNESDDPELIFGQPRPPCGVGGLVICDESSMVDTELHGDLYRQTSKRRGAQILYVGDREQLPPVRGTWGPPFDSPDAELREIHRQAADSPIVGLATAVRTRQPFDGWIDGVCDTASGDPVPWLCERKDSDAVLLAYTNATRRRLNAEIRAQLGLTGVVCPNDRIVCLLNNHGIGIMNGEAFDVLRAERGPASGWLWLILDVPGRDVRVLVSPSTFGGRVGDFRRAASRLRFHHRAKALHVDTGWALTVHKSQGSEWKSVGFVADGGYAGLRLRDPAEARRLTYTAITRAAETLRIFR